MSVAPPILDIFVVWHPDELGGEDLFAQLDDHYHSPAFSGLAEGAVDVCGRSVAWAPGTAPRPLGIEAELAPGVAAEQYNVIVLYIGVGLAQAVLNDPDWERYGADIAQLADRDSRQWADHCAAPVSHLGARGRHSTPSSSGRPGCAMRRVHALTHRHDGASRRILTRPSRRN